MSVHFVVAGVAPTDKYRRPAGATDPPEYAWLYGVPAIVYTGGFLFAASTGMSGLVQAGYLTSSVLCISTSYVIHTLTHN